LAQAKVGLTVSPYELQLLTAALVTHKTALEGENLPPTIIVNHSTDSLRIDQMVRDLGLRFPELPEGGEDETED
jgi:hypothetical protein